MAERHDVEGHAPVVERLAGFGAGDYFAEPNITALAYERSLPVIEQTRQEAQAAQQRVEELREALARRKRKRANAIREGIQ